MKRLLFLHGFYASGRCPAALALRDALRGEAEVLTPDLPLSPAKALDMVLDTLQGEQVDLMVGNSNGAFLAAIAAGVAGVPALLGNPHLRMTEFLASRMGPQRYKSPRSDGKMEFVITPTLIEEFREIQALLRELYNPFYRDRIWGLFGTADQLAHFEEEFLALYSAAFHFPGGHTPTPEEVRDHYAPLARALMERHPRPHERYFQHFKGGVYRLITVARDSETLLRQAVYESLAGHAVWVRDERMFFSHVQRDGYAGPRFREISPADAEAILTATG